MAAGVAYSKPHLIGQATLINSVSILSVALGSVWSLAYYRKREEQTDDCLVCNEYLAKFHGSVR